MIYYYTRTRIRPNPQNNTENTEVWLNIARRTVIQENDGMIHVSKEQGVVSI